MNEIVNHSNPEEVWRLYHKHRPHLGYFGITKSDPVPKYYHHKNTLRRYNAITNLASFLIITGSFPMLYKIIELGYISNYQEFCKRTHRNLWLVEHYDAMVARYEEYSRFRSRTNILN